MNVTRHDRRRADNALERPRRTRLGRDAGAARPGVQTLRRPARRSGFRWVRSSGARRRLRHGQHNARRRAAARRKGRCIGIDISEPMIAAAREPRRTGRHAGKLHPRRRADPRVRARKLRHDHLALRRHVLRRSASRPLRTCGVPQASDAELRFIAWRSAAENPFMTTAERAAAPLLPNLPARRPDAPGQFAFADQRPGPRHPGGERLGRDRYPADRCRLHPAREGVGPLPDPARSRRPDPSRGGRTDSRAGHRDGPRRLRSLCARSGSPLYRGLLDGSRPSPAREPNRSAGAARAIQ